MIENSVQPLNMLYKLWLEYVCDLMPFRDLTEAYERPWTLILVVCLGCTWFFFFFGCICLMLAIAMIR